jgi:enoyl-CoA hydratase/carnithine racemase
MTEQSESPIRWEQSSDGGVTLLLDAPDAPVNTITTAYVEALADLVDQLERVQDEIPGVVIRSAKKSFLAGGDLHRLMAVEPAAVDEFVADLDRRKSTTRRLELLRCPVVAVINGPVLGGGLELAMSCHRSIAIDDGRAVAGLPESTLGLIPGAGGIVRTVDRLGIDHALDAIIVPGQRFGLRKALEAGLIDEVVPSIEEADAAAASWMAAHRGNPRRVFQRPPSRRRTLPPATAVPVARAITATANAVLDRDIDAALHVESVALGAVVTSAATKNSIRINFFETTALRKQARSLTAEPAASVLLEPTRESSMREVTTLAAQHHTITVTELASASDHPSRPDARIVLNGVQPDYWPLLWIVGDTVGDGQRVVEYMSNESYEASAAISALARAGVLPVKADAAVGPLRRGMDRALDQIVASQRRSGVADERIAAALKWAGLDAAAEALGPGVKASSAEAELACDLLDAVALAGITVLGETEGVLDGVVSVRAGGFPSWTGGVREWVRGGRELARELAAIDVAAAIEAA